MLLTAKRIYTEGVVLAALLIVTVMDLIKIFVV